MSAIVLWLQFVVLLGVAIAYWSDAISFESAAFGYLAIATFNTLALNFKSLTPIPPVS